MTAQPAPRSHETALVALSGSRRRGSDRTQPVQSFALDLAASRLAYAEIKAALDVGKLSGDASGEPGRSN